MFERRRREEAEGERRMMGSGRRWCFVEGAWGMDGLMGGLPTGRDVVVRDLEGRERERNVSAILRTWEKSWMGLLVERWWGKGKRAYGGFDASEDAVPIAHSAFSVVDFL